MPQVHVSETRKALNRALDCLGTAGAAESRDPHIQRAVYYARRAVILLTGAQPNRIIGTDPSPPRPLPFPKEID